MTEDGLPLIGAVPGHEGAYVAAGHSVWDMLNAPATGEAMAELILDGGASHVDLAPFAPERLPPLDAAPVRWKALGEKAGAAHRADASRHCVGRCVVGDGGGRLFGRYRSFGSVVRMVRGSQTCRPKAKVRSSNLLGRANIHRHDNATMLGYLVAPPGNRLEALRRDLAGRHSIRINDQWRIVFRWSDEGPVEVEIMSASTTGSGVEARAWREDQLYSRVGNSMKY